MKRIITQSIAVTVLIPTMLLAHGGGLDRNGCHTNRKTGSYHCHGGGLAAAAPSAQSVPATRIQPLITNTSSTSIATLEQRIAALEKRVAELERRR